MVVILTPRVAYFQVKPYIPYDIIPFNEPVPMLGWAQKDRTVTELRCPSWIYEADIPFREVLFSPAAEVAMEAAFGTRQKQAGKKSFFATRNLTEVKCLIKQVQNLLMKCNFLCLRIIFCDHTCDIRFCSKILGAEIREDKKMIMPLTPCTTVLLIT